MQFNTKRLFHNRINVNSAELIHLTEKLFDSYTDLVTYYDLIKKLPKEVFCTIWSTPESYLWSKITWDLLYSNSIKSKFLINYLEWSATTHNKQINKQVDKLGLFIISGYMSMQSDIMLPKYVKIPKQGSFPAIGVSWKHKEGFEIIGFKNKNIIARINNKLCEFPIKNTKIPNDQNQFFFQPKIKKSNLTIDIWSECSIMDFDGMEWIERVKEITDLNRFSITLSKSLEMIQEFDSKTYNDLSMLLKKVVPLKVISTAVPSSSNSTILGVVFCTFVDDPLLLAEMLIHECSHNKLFLLQEEDPILDSNIHGDGWADDKYYSPWRSDPRPLNGILHGLYVFSEVINFWSYIINTKKKKDYNHISFKRFYLLVEQAKIALDVLKEHASFTKLGSDFISDIDMSITDHRSKITKKDLKLTSAHFAELNFDPDLLGNNVINAITKHKNKWMAM